MFLAVQVNASEDSLEAGIGAQRVSHGLHRHITQAVVVLCDRAVEVQEGVVEVAKSQVYPSDI